jgi:streptogramin lyase/two-component sensor histidine kinase
LHRFRNGAFEKFTIKEGLSSDRVWTILEDHEGSLWIGTYGGGLNRLKSGKVTMYTSQEGMPNDFVRAILQEPDGTFWIGTEGGLSHYSNGAFHNYTAQDGLSHNVVWAIARDSGGSLWIGTYGGGVSRMQKGRFSAYNTASGLSNNFVHCVIADSHDRIWIGTNGGGLNLLENGKFQVYDTAHGLSNNTIRSILEDRSGKIWIGTYGGGLNVLSDGRIETITRRDGLASDFVLSIHQSADDSLWIGTYGGGVSRIRNRSIATFNTKTGLPDDVIYQVLEDGPNLWFSSNRGIFFIPKTSFDQQSSPLRYTLFNASDGMRSSECNSGSPGGVRSSDGRIWFPTIRGLAMIDPSRIRQNGIPPPIVLEKLTLGEENAILPDDISRNHVLPPGTRNLEFHYTALSYLVPEKVRFQYKLEGFDPGWIDAGDRRAAYYTHLPPGNYTFRVKGSNNDGVWNELKDPVRITMSPHFYQTGWFLVLSAATVVFLTAFAHRRRVRRIQAERKHLEKVVRERTRDLQLTAEKLEAALVIKEKQEQELIQLHTQAELDAVRARIHPHFLFNSLNSIAALTASDSSKAETMIEKLSEFYRYVLQASRSQFIRLSEELAMIESYLEIEKVRLGERLAYDIRCRVEAEAYWIPGLLIQPLVENSVHHGIIPKLGRGRIEIVAESCGDGSLRLAVADDGIGFRKEDTGRGYGLSSIRERLRLLYKDDASIRIQHQQGVQIEIVLPIAAGRVHAVADSHC